MSFKEKRLEEVKGDLLLLGIGLGAENQSRIPKIFKDLEERLGIKLNNEEQKKARDVAVLKRDSKEFKAFFGEVLERQENKESEMGRKEILNKEKTRKIKGRKSKEKYRKVLEVAKTERIEDLNFFLKKGWEIIEKVKGTVLDSDTKSCYDGYGAKVLHYSHMQVVFILGRFKKKVPTQKEVYEELFKI